MDTFISREILDMLSYRSGLGQSLKQISLRETPFSGNGTKLYQEYSDGLIQTKQDFFNRLADLKVKPMGDKKIYIVAKVFDQSGCLAYIEDMKEFIDRVSQLNRVARVCSVVLTTI